MSRRDEGQRISAWLADLAASDKNRRAPEASATHRRALLEQLPHEFLTWYAAMEYPVDMTIQIQDLRRFIRQCDPARPLEVDDSLYVPLDNVRGGVSFVETLCRTITLSDTESCQLFTGFPGAGKTTELKRLAKRLEDAKDLPIYIKFEEYIDSYSPIGITDVKRVVAYCMDREATVAEGKDPNVRTAEPEARVPAPRLRL